MNGAGDEFFSSSGFAQYEDSGIRWRHFCHLRQYAAKWFGRPNDLFEHGGTVDFFAQHEIFILRPFLAPLAIVDVGSRCIPTHEVSLFVAQRVVTDEEPTKLSVLSSALVVRFRKGGLRPGAFSLLLDILEILRMKDSGAKVLGLHVFHAQARIIQHCLVRVQDFPIRVHNVDGLGYGIRNPSKLDLVLP